MTKVDPELIRQMDTESASSHPVEAVFMLRPEDPSHVVNAPEVTAELAKKVLDRVKHHTGISPDAVNIFRNLGSFVVVALPRFLHVLMQQPEIASAVANRQPGSAVIPPINKRPASISEIGSESKENGTERQTVGASQSRESSATRKRILKYK